MCYLYVLPFATYTDIANPALTYLTLNHLPCCTKNLRVSKKAMKRRYLDAKRIAWSKPKWRKNYRRRNDWKRQSVNGHPRQLQVKIVRGRSHNLAPAIATNALGPKSEVESVSRKLSALHKDATRWLSAAFVIVAFRLFHYCPSSPTKIILSLEPLAITFSLG
jgi:hypothetical protein